MKYLADLALLALLADLCPTMIVCNRQFWYELYTVQYSTVKKNKHESRSQEKGAATDPQHVEIMLHLLKAASRTATIVFTTW